MAKKKKPNPHCPVAGCGTTKPHTDDPMVKGMMLAFSPPEKMTLWARTAMSELAHSIGRDLQDKKIFAWHSRLRQPEELYIRTLYALFVATDKELPHIISGEMPNGITRLYDAVNTLVFENRGLLRTEQPGLYYGSFTPMDTLNDGAHASFRSFMTCIGLSRNPGLMPPADVYTKHVQTYCHYLNYMYEMFKAGKGKADVLAGVRNMHKPATAWQASG
jgi:hypothetical protein